MTRLLKCFCVTIGGLLCFSVQAESARTVHCDYKYLMTPAAQIDAGFWPNGEIQSSVILTMGMGGSSEKKTATPVALASGEFAHAIISKEVSNGSLELIIYSERQPQGDSRLINPVFKQEFWGTCHWQ